VGLTPGDLVLCSGTLKRGISFADRVRAAREGGFAGISLWGRDYQAARDEGLRDRDIRAMLDDNGLAVAELDPVWWWLPGARDVVIPPEYDTEDMFRFGEDTLFEIAGAMGARSINAVDVFGGEWSMDQAAGAFADLCDRAAEHGLLVHLEFLPWSRIDSVQSAHEIARLADRPNGGIVVDAWHFFRGPSDPESLRAVPGDRILNVQLDDGPARPEPDLLSATLHERLLPGQGEFDLAWLVDVLVTCGANAPFGVEVFSDDLHSLEPAEAGRRAGEAARRVLGTDR
jgi:sugar phosphate isomerase/epimerase